MKLKETNNFQFVFSRHLYGCVRCSGRAVYLYRVSSIVVYRVAFSLSRKSPLAFDGQWFTEASCSSKECEENVALILESGDTDRKGI